MSLLRVIVGELLPGIVSPTPRETLNAVREEIIPTLIARAADPQGTTIAKIDSLCRRLREATIAVRESDNEFSGQIATDRVIIRREGVICHQIDRKLGVESIAEQLLRSVLLRMGRVDAVSAAQLLAPRFVKDFPVSLSAPSWLVSEFKIREWIGRSL